MISKQEALETIKEFQTLMAAPPLGAELNTMLRRCLEIQNDCDRRVLSLSAVDKDSLEALIEDIKDEIISY